MTKYQISSMKAWLIHIDTLNKEKATYHDLPHLERIIKQNEKDFFAYVAAMAAGDFDEM